MTHIAERVDALRELMIRENLDAYVVYSQDPHGSEYVAEHWRCRTWISGFTGSAGIFALTKKGAGLWTDFRYFIQAEQELEGSGIRLFKMDTPGTPDYKTWLSEQLGPGSRVGLDGRTLTLKEWQALGDLFLPREIGVANRLDLIGELWRDRPGEPCSTLWQLGPDEAGESRREKLLRVRREMARLRADRYLISSLDDVAWLLNIRGGDVPYNPVVQSYLCLSGEEAFLYLPPGRLSPEDRSALEADGVAIRSYGEVLTDLAALPRGESIFLSADKTNSLTAGALPEGMKVLQGVDITTRMKARKNRVEQAQIRKAMEKDGAALVRFFIWLEGALAEGAVTELEAAEALRGFRSRQPDFLDESFSPIPGYRAHGAICHYEAAEEEQFTLEAAGLFLIDSGAQYRQGTTDITRTLALGEPTAQEIRDYTLVLKGHIALSMARFPRGTRGYQLDILARKPLWEAGWNYGHGTGHGVGFVLNVHEGPQRISPHPVDEALEEGMVTSNEPGIYREGEYGIRIENLVLTQPWEECPTEAPFFRFETLSLCPYDQKLIDPALLTAEEKLWLNDYQREVLRRLSPLLEESERLWLEKAACEIA